MRVKIWFKELGNSKDLLSYSVFINFSEKNIGPHSGRMIKANSIVINTKDENYVYPLPLISEIEIFEAPASKIRSDLVIEPMRAPNQ
jgi:hypothetical protein